MDPFSDRVTLKSQGREPRAKNNFRALLQMAGVTRKMAMVDDRELLRRYARHQAEEAFAELVQRHLPLVYSAALRQVGGDRHMAQDVTQSVFSDLARKAASLAQHELLTGWLYTSTRF